MAWTNDELTTAGKATELQVASYRKDGTLRPYVTIWAVRAGEELYIRSAYGPDNGWYRRAVASGTGRIRAGDVDFTAADPGAHAGIDAAYHAKYDSYGPAIVNTVVGATGAAATLRLQPHD